LYNYGLMMAQPRAEA